jgi:hypothetical protein
MRSRFSSLWYIPGVEVVLNALIIISKTNRNQALATWKNMMDQSEPAADGEGHKKNGRKKICRKTCCSGLTRFHRKLTFTW